MVQVEQFVTQHRNSESAGGMYTNHMFDTTVTSNLLLALAGNYKFSIAKQLAMCAKPLEIDCSQGRASKLGIAFQTSSSAKITWEQ